MNFLYSLFKQDPDSREGVILTTSWLAVIVNLLCAAVKILIGIFASSLAIISEGLNNAADGTSSILTIIGTKLAGKHPTKEHPFGYGRVEYFTSLIIATLIMITGFESIKEAISSIFEPSKMEVSILIVLIIAVFGVVKYLLGNYMLKQGERIGSASLKGIGKECKADCIVSVVTIISTVIYLCFDLSLDAYAGIITSLFILKAGYDILKETAADLLGTAGDKELADELYQLIRSNPIVINAADMMLHNYGPDAYSGSVNIEVDHRLTVEEIYASIHSMQLEIMHEHHIAMVFGIYAVDEEHEGMQELRAYIEKFVQEKEHVTSFHALYVDPKNEDIYCDLVVDYELGDWEELRSEFRDYMKQAYPTQRLELVIETEYV